MGPVGTRPEIFAYGLREPWRFSFDPRSGAMVIGDVGGDIAEELDLLPRRHRGAANFGWPTFEGFVRRQAGQPANYVAPVIQRLHSRGWCAVIGGYVGRDRSVPALYGRYLYGDLCSGALRSAILKSRRERDDRPVVPTPFQLASFGEDGIGRLYVIAPGGAVYRVTRG